MGYRVGIGCQHGARAIEVGPLALSVLWLVCSARKRGSGTWTHEVLFNLPG